MAGFGASEAGSAQFSEVRKWEYEAGRKSGPLFTLNGNLGWNAMIERHRWSDDNSVELAKGRIIKADTIRELAAKIKKDPDSLEKTIATWNRSCAAGNDSEFGRPAD